MTAEGWRQGAHNLYASVNARQNEEARNEERLLAIVRKLEVATANQVRRYARDISIRDIAGILEQLARAGALQIMETTRKGTLRYCVSEA